jgi:tight adherence protein B
LAKVESKLEQASLSISAGELIFFVLGLTGLASFGGLLIGGPIIAMVLGLIALLIPIAVVNFKASKRLKKFETQLPDTLQLLASSLRAGYSVLQALDAVSKECPEPMSDELKRVLSEAQLGRDINLAMLDIAERMGSRDFEWAALAINIQREVGGNLAELLETVAETMVERERLRREVSALTAEGRVSAGVLAILPPILGVVLYVVNPDYTNQLFQDPLGRVFLGLGVVMLVIGFIWMKKTVSIKV